MIVDKRKNDDKICLFESESHSLTRNGSTYIAQ